MKALILKFMGRAAPYVMDDIYDAMINSGHDALLLDMVEKTKDVPQERSYSVVIDSLLSGVQSFLPDFVIGYGATNILTMPTSSGPVDIVTTLQIPSFSVFYDNPIDPRTFDQTYRFYNKDLHYFLVWDRHYTEELKKLGYENSHFMPIASNTRRFKPLDYNEEDAKKFSADVSFVGSYTPKREIIMSALVEAGLDVVIWGYEWEKAQNPKLHASNRGVVDNLTELVKVYNYSKVNINVTVDQGISSLNMRVFDCMATGGFLISDYKTDFDELFDAEKEAATFRRVSELPDMVKYYLEHEDERKEIAKAGRKRVLADHNYRKRIGFMEELLERDGRFSPPRWWSRLSESKSRIMGTPAAAASAPKEAAS